MRVLIIGGGRRIGMPLAAALAGEDHEIYILNRDPQSRVARSQQAPGIEAMIWDGRTADSWAGLIDEDTTILNLNEDIVLQGHRHLAGADDHLRASQAIVEAIMRAPHKPATLIHANSIAYYGDCEDDMVVEQTPPGASPQARACHTLEQSLNHLPVRACLLRIGLVLDPGTPILAHLAEQSAVGAVRDGQAWVSWVHQQDVLRAIRFLINDGVADGPFNVVAPQPVTRQRLLDIVTNTLGHGVLPADGFAPGNAAPLYECQRVIPQRLQSLGFRFRFPEAEDALRHLLLCS